MGGRECIVASPRISKVGEKLCYNSGAPDIVFSWKSEDYGSYLPLTSLERIQNRIAVSFQFPFSDYVTLKAYESFFDCRFFPG